MVIGLKVKQVKYLVPVERKRNLMLFNKPEELRKLERVLQILNPTAANI